MNFTINPKHRNQTPKKSQWSISVIEEKKCFKIMKLLKTYWPQEVGWTVFPKKRIIRAIGISSDKKRILFIAKFISDHQNNWHGFPADTQKNPQDIPSPKILNLWLNMKIFSPAKIRKISKGQSWIP